MFELVHSKTNCLFPSSPLPIIFALYCLSLLQGDVGENGLAGAAGEPGDDGDPGEMGNTGLTGDSGLNVSEQLFTHGEFQP